MARWELEDRMRFTELVLPGVFLIELEPIEDARGSFACAWNADEMVAHGLESRVVQCNLSTNRRKGTIRGMHRQLPPHEEVKVVRCLRGALFDVVIDLRTDSPTSTRWTGIELSAEDRRMLYVPRGFAHGFQTLEDETEVFYIVSEAYAPQAETGLRWDDPAFGIEWPLGAPTVISDKDRAWPDFAPV